MKKIMLFIASKKGYTVLKKVLDSKYRELIGYVYTFKETNVRKDYSSDIIKICEENRLFCSLWNKNSGPYLINTIVENKITSAFAISWKYLIDLNINEYLEDKLIVFHDSLLPRYRGFAPTPTAIMCGEETIGVSALYATKGIDEGEIIEQRKQAVNENMYIEEIIDEQSIIYYEMFNSIVSKMLSNKITAYKQREEDATYSIWRDEIDCRINWDDEAKKIMNLIRAVSYPYAGAYTFLDGKKIIIDKASLIEKDINFQIRNVGKIWTLNNNEPIIVCGKGLLKILSAHDELGNKIMFNKIRKRFI